MKNYLVTFQESGEDNAIRIKALLEQLDPDNWVEVSHNQMAVRVDSGASQLRAELRPALKTGQTVSVFEIKSFSCSASGVTDELTNRGYTIQ
ncbi:hypothetical protein [Lacticaseibacillus parakribbianus]|uniref:hypothetical protein n=1 Tax=Lacticaseibacillus parakribbianus TaxID=2970927 RepID=UPI0021CAFB7D|nr:hypothetical protein [Lacticaseibacillus parakribbianus]